MWMNKERVKLWVAKHCAIRVGSNRVVIDFLRLGFVVKFPIIHLVVFAQELKLFPKGLQELSFWEWVRWPMHCGGYTGGKRILFKGIADNWEEFWFSFSTGHPFARVTVFSFFGLMNIQKAGDVVQLDRRLFRRRVETIIGSELFCLDSHHFSSPSNFGIVDGRLCMFDYGDPKTRRVIREVGMCLHNNFRCDDIG